MAVAKSSTTQRKRRLGPPKPQQITRLRVKAKAELTKPTRLGVQARSRIKTKAESSK